MEFLGKIWIASLALNLFFLYAVFDILFKSPVIQISVHHKPDSTSHSSVMKRIVFIVADGLRADTFYKRPDKHPFLTNLMQSNTPVVWGISSTKVPTESRPGHVALFAGIYEDPSAIFTGWKHNLVTFDTVFDFTSYSILLGSPDIVHMFKKDATSDKIYVDAYPGEWQDFMSYNSSILDVWVLEKFNELVTQGKIPYVDKGFIFLHLLGIDNTGHASKPQSEEYLASISLADNIVKEVQEKISQYFLDNATLFVFTSDHGMTDRGSHGDGSIDETETPFVIWGPGLVSKRVNQHISQVDFPSLIAGALGIHFPSNSLGKFPLIWENQKFTFECLVGNFRQLHELVLARRSNLEKRMLPIIAFPHELIAESGFNESVLLASEGKYEEAVEKMVSMLELLQEGNTYYERYDQTLLFTVTMSSWAIWLLILGVSFSLHQKEGTGSGTVHFPYGKFLIYDSVISAIVTKGIFGWSLCRTAYLVVMLYLIRLLKSTWKETGEFHLATAIPLTAFSFVLVEILVLTFYYREALVIGLFVGILWWIMSGQHPRQRVGAWLLSTVLLSVFPLLPITHQSNPYFVSVAAICTGVFSFTMAWRLSHKLPNLDTIILISQVTTSLLTSIVVHFPESMPSRLFSWGSLVLTVLPKFMATKTLFVKLLAVFLALNAPFSLLSSAYESLFLSSLFLVLVCVVKHELAQDSESWSEFFERKLDGLEETEHRLHPKFPKSKSMKLFLTTAWLHLFFTFYSFFGIGNISSISSFNPSNVLCFLSVFRPFIMMSLLLVKILIPFLLVATVFRVFTWNKKDADKNFHLVLLLSQAMALQMFVLVRNEGSWLEIGTSISRFVIVQVATLFLSLLHILSGVIMSSEVRFKPRIKKSA